MSERRRQFSIGALMEKKESLCTFHRTTPIKLGSKLIDFLYNINFHLVDLQELDAFDKRIYAVEMVFVQPRISKPPAPGTLRFPM
jgi:hypothetical protein